MSSSPNFHEISFLFLQLLENCISDKDIERLEHLFSEEPGLMEEYCDFVKNYTALQMKFHDRYDEMDDMGENCIFLTEFLKEMSLYEKTADVIEPRKAEPKQEIIQKVVYHHPPRKIDKLSVFAAVLSIAAILLIVLFVRVVPVRNSFEVATFIDSIDATWADTSASMEKGDRLLTHETLSLSQGIVNIQTDQGITLLIEGPAKFAMDEAMNLNLDYGRVYARVPAQGIGFSVNTVNSKVIDLGTEFGIQATTNDQMEVHVLKGKIQLIAGEKNALKTTQSLVMGQARRIGPEAVIETIPINQQKFVQTINSQLKLVWRNQRKLDLADIVGAGDGFGTGQPNSGVDFETGIIRPVDAEAPSYRNPQYTAAQHPFIDGVFMPDGGEGPVQIASSGISYDGFPDTHGDCYVPVCNNHKIKKGFDGDSEYGALMIQGEKATGQPAPRICLHSNAGITFDLAAIRQSLSGIRIDRFKTRFGLIQSNRQIPIDVDLFILVDGRKVFSHSGYLSTDPALNIDLELHETDRFLTLVCMEGTENSGDWPLFVGPILELSPKQ